MTRLRFDDRDAHGRPWLLDLRLCRDHGSDILILSDSTAWRATVDPRLHY